MSKIQKLENKLKSVSGSEKVELLDDLAYAMYGSDPEKADYYAKEALALAKKLDFTKGIARSNLIIGIVYLVTGNYVEAMRYYAEALAIYEEMGDSHGIAMSLRRMGLIYWNQSDFDLAMEYYLKALQLREKIEDKHGIAESLNDIAFVHYNLEEFNKALEYLQKSLVIRSEVGDKHGIAICYNRIGVIYSKQDAYDQALDYFTRSLDVRKELGEVESVYAVDLYCNIGDVYIDSHNYDQALINHRKALQISINLGYKEGIILSHISIGAIQTQHHDFDNAMENLQDGLRLSKEIGLREKEQKCYHLLAQLYRVQGDYEEAYSFYQQYSTLKQDIYHEIKSKQITDLQTHYESEKNKRDAEIYRLKNVELVKEISERKQAQDELNKNQEQLEELVQERTSELENSNEQLEQKNIALGQVLEHLEKQRQNDQIKSYRDVEEAIIPFLKRLQSDFGSTHEIALKELEISLNAILGKDKDEFIVRYAKLSAREFEICEMLKDGLTSKQMSDHLNLSLRTIEKHREQIRKKLGLTNKAVSLATYLRTH